MIQYNIHKALWDRDVPERSKAMKARLSWNCQNHLPIFVPVSACYFTDTKASRFQYLLEILETTCPVISRNSNIVTTDPHARKLERVSFWSLSVGRIGRWEQAFRQCNKWLNGQGLIFQSSIFWMPAWLRRLILHDIVRLQIFLETQIMPLTQARVTITKSKGRRECRQDSCVSESPKIITVLQKGMKREWSRALVEATATDHLQ